jgi:hypothetical protein
MDFDGVEHGAELSMHPLLLELASATKCSSTPAAMALLSFRSLSYGSAGIDV